MGQLSLLENELEQLPEREEKRRAELEKIIVVGIKAAIEAWCALHEIRQKRYYRSTHHTWEEYCDDVLGVCRQVGIQYANAGEVVEIVSNCLQNDGVPAEQITMLLPQNESQIRPLVPYRKNHETIGKVWRRVIDTAPEGKKTAKFVQQALFDEVGKKNKESTGKTRAAINKEERYTPEFKTAFEGFLQEIELAMNTRYKHTSREAILKHLDALRENIVNDGAALPDYAIRTKTDAGKLIEAGFRILRTNPESLCIETQTPAGWEHFATCESADDLNSQFAHLMTHSAHIQG